MKYIFAFKNLLDKHPHLLVILVGILIRLPLLFAPLNSYGTDAWRQADTASIAYHFYVNGHNLFYPQIFWGGNGPGYVETEFQLYTYIVSFLYSFWGEKIWLGRLVSLLFSISAWLVFYQLAKKVLDKTTSATWVLYFLIFSPLYLRYSLAFMPEATVMFFYITALWFYINWLSDSKSSTLFLAALCTSLAVLVKPTSIHIGPILALLAFYQWKLAVLKRKDVWIAIAIVIIPAFLWYWHARELFREFGNTFGLLSGGDSKFGSLATWLSPHFYLSLIQLDVKWVLGYGMVLLFGLGIISALKRKDEQLVVFGVAVVALYYMIVARYSREEWGIQYHVYMMPFAALTVGIGINGVLEKFNILMQRRLIWGSAFIVFFASTVLFGQMLFPGNDNLLECANHVKSLVPVNQRIIVSSTSGATDNGVPNNYQEPEIFFYSRRYGWSLPADRHTVAELTRLHNLGGAYFVIYSKELLENNQRLYQYLKSNALQVGPGIDSGCAIYQLNN